MATAKLTAGTHGSDVCLPATYLLTYYSSDACGFVSFVATARACGASRRAVGIPLQERHLAKGRHDTTLSLT